MNKQALIYDARYARYIGRDSTGGHLEIDGDAYAEARQQRQRDGDSYEAADAATSDPDGWTEDMAGFIPASEHLSREG